MLNGCLEDSSFVYLEFAFRFRSPSLLALPSEFATVHDSVSYFHLILDIMVFATMHHEAVGPLEGLHI